MESNWKVLMLWNFVHICTYVCIYTYIYMNNIESIYTEYIIYHIHTHYEKWLLGKCNSSKMWYSVFVWRGWAFSMFSLRVVHGCTTLPDQCSVLPVGWLLAWIVTSYLLMLEWLNFKTCLKAFLKVVFGWDGNVMNQPASKNRCFFVFSRVNSGR